MLEILSEMLLEPYSEGLADCPAAPPTRRARLARIALEVFIGQKELLGLLGGIDGLTRRTRPGEGGEVAVGHVGAEAFPQVRIQDPR